MSAGQKQKWITGEEYGRERIRLIKAGVAYDAAEFQALESRVIERDDYLYEKFGKEYLDTNRGKWIGISLDGEVVICDRPGALIWTAAEKFGDGNFSMRKLDDFPGYQSFR